MKRSEIIPIAKFMQECTWNAYKGNKISITLACLIPGIIFFKFSMFLSFLYTLQLLLIVGFAWCQGDIAGRKAGLDIVLEVFRKHNDEKIISMLNDLPSPEKEKIN